MIFLRNGETVAAFEREFAAYVGACHAIAHNSGTSTLHTALVARGVKPGDRVAVPPLTMAATTMAVLHAGAVPVFVDVDPDTWLMGWPYDIGARGWTWAMPVSLYGLTQPLGGPIVIDDAAQTLRQHSGCAFTSYSFQASKILPLGEGGMLVTNDDDLARRAREFSSLGYRMGDGPKIDPATLKSPTYARHHSLGWNYRMSDWVARQGLSVLETRWAFAGEHYGEYEVARLLRIRQECAALYREAIQGCDWLTPQKVPKGWGHSWWTFAVATDTPERCLWLLDAMERHGGERPYPAWRLTYHEPAFAHLAGPTSVEQGGKTMALKRVGVCPVAEDLQPRLVQFQTNDLASAKQNAKALRKCIEDAG